ncbi:hypothetical protein HMPREF1985_01194 [Mitsuokella sp. oral taxon 131 str. W9106]|nr:hypothetical protein HMPREF1985_01194 [Mitsuokella sp. oral taxon 131 str. W9106]
MALLYVRIGRAVKFSFLNLQKKKGFLKMKRIKQSRWIFDKIHS